MGSVQRTQCTVVGVCCCRRGRMKCTAVKSIVFTLTVLYRFNVSKYLNNIFPNMLSYYLMVKFIIYLKMGIPTFLKCND